jgi:U3 small nucleolar RNA-associated protein 13
VCSWSDKLVLLMRRFLLLSLQIKGISELLEGLIPYSQRHFSRVDRLVRSTFLLDYTLMRMSVVDPDVDAGTIKDEMNGSSVENGELAEPRPASPVPQKSSKKRKSGKSGKKGKEKKVKVASSGLLSKDVSVEP